MAEFPSRNLDKAEASPLKFKVLSLLSLVSVLSSCSDGTSTSISSPSAFSLRFHAANGTLASDVSCDAKLLQLGTTKIDGELLDLAFFVHGLEFLKSDGSVVEAKLEDNAWQNQNVALMDFQDKGDNCSGDAKTTHTVITGEVSSLEDIVAVRFTLGIPPELNHVDPQSVEEPLNAANMFWSWQSGYKAFRFDVSPEGGITRPDDPDFLGTNYFFHLGSTDCQGDPIAGQAVTCARVNQPVIELSGFQLGSSEIVLDLAELIKGLDLKTDRAETPGCMSAIDDLECETYFTNLGMNLSRGAMDETLKQSVFRIK